MLKPRAGWQAHTHPPTHSVLKMLRIARPEQRTEPPVSARPHSALSHGVRGRQPRHPGVPSAGPGPPCLPGAPRGRVLSGSGQRRQDHRAMVESGQLTRAEPHFSTGHGQPGPFEELGVVLSGLTQDLAQVPPTAGQGSAGCKDTHPHSAAAVMGRRALGETPWPQQLPASSPPALEGLVPAGQTSVQHGRLGLQGRRWGRAFPSGNA